MSTIAILFFLVVIPIIIGAAGAKMISLKGSRLWLAAFPMGFFLELAMFQFLTFPWAIINLPFSSLCVVFIFVLLIISIISILYCKKSGTIEKISLPSFTAWKWVYGVAAIILISWQVFHMVHSDIGYWSSDDSIYGSIANDALMTNVLFRNNPDTGVASIFNIGRAMQTSLVFPAFLSFVSGLSVATVFHTVLGVYYLLLAYGVYCMLGKTLFKTTENMFVFLIVLSVLYVFGLYTIYSQTYRLLGPSTQGKAVLAVSFFPFLYTLFILKLQDNYDRKFGFVLLLLSAAASSMTLFGAVTMIGNVMFPVIVSMIRRKRCWKNLRYVLWGCAVPSVCCGIYFYRLLIP